MRLKSSVNILAALLFCIPALAVTIHPSQAKASASCQSQTLSKVTSPNKSWDAVTYLYYCGGDYSFASTLITHVKLVSASNATISSDVFAIDSGGNSHFTPAVSWINQNHLQISTVRSNMIGLQKTTFSGVTIGYTYH